MNGDEAFQNDQYMRRLLKLIEQQPDAQYTLIFKGRSMPATFGDAVQYVNAEGMSYISINFWDGDTGNMFDVDYRLVPQKVFANGKLLI